MLNSKKWQTACERVSNFQVYHGGWLYCFTILQQYSSYIVAVSFIGGGNRSTRGKPPTCRKSLTNFITCIMASTSEVSNLQNSSAHPRVAVKQIPLNGELSDYNTESQTVDHSREHVWRVPRSLHAKYLFSQYVNMYA